MIDIDNCTTMDFSIKDKKFRVERHAHHHTVEMERNGGFIQLGMIAEDKLARGNERYHAVQTSTPWEKLTYQEYMQATLPTSPTLRGSINNILSVSGHIR